MTDFTKGQRVVVKIKKNQWYVGTLTRATKLALSVTFDDGATARVTPEDFRHVHLIATKRSMKNVLEDVQAKALFLTTSGMSTKFDLVFTPSDAGEPYLTSLSNMVLWLHGVVDRYKFSNDHIAVERNLGSVGIARTFRTESDTRKKYQRAVRELNDAFARSPLWRLQVTSGGKEFFSTNGVFRAVFYDIKNLLSDDPKERKIGLYLMRRVGR